ncbi:EAL domain-containing protein [Sulfurospirillum sp. T05]|uniref:EAL domain-containing protein n=1 Tax=Sulfurospirillum tamanense TaxID=2813362 RepID=A0ABS2WRE4_9BACT|nr:EAL domain-containing protein [Sulfurospirillum tamanensis]MBN2964244.1 EAL domain-containing protein [Sulfurospirillum tamanensis]
MQITTLVHNYGFTEEDAFKLREIRPLLVLEIDRFIQEFYLFVFRFEHAKKFIQSPEAQAKHQQEVTKWFKSLFGGAYGKFYILKLKRISEAHVNIGLPAHYVNAAFSFVRRFIKEVLIDNGRLCALGAVDKIIDINLDVLTISYQEEEQSKLIHEVVFLRKSIKASAITPYAQPIYNSRSLLPEKNECLMRLIDPLNKEVHSILPYLETSKKVKLYRALMQQMVQKSFAFFSTKAVDFSLNLSYEDITDEPFVAELFSYIDGHMAPKHIIFEIVESDFIQDFAVVDSFAKKIRAKGCKLAIDDFGSGFSSMHHVLALKPEYIKIDGSLIKHLDTSSQSRTVVRNIVNMAQELGAKTIAEYIHNEAILRQAQALGVDYLQGFHLAKPAPLENA